MPHGVDAAVDDVQPPVRHPMRDRAPPQPERRQLAPRHNAVVRLRESRYLPLSLGELCTICGAK